MIGPRLSTHKAIAQVLEPARCSLFGRLGLERIGYLLILTGGTQLSRLIKLKVKGDIFNKSNESFPQEERFLENEFSINLPTVYKLKGKLRKAWINVINPFRALLVIGTPGAGKSYFVIRHVITQHIKKGFTMFLYDFKYDDLAKIAYNTLLKFGKAFPVQPKFYVINFDNIIHRCNLWNHRPCSILPMRQNPPER